MLSDIPLNMVLYTFQLAMYLCLSHKQDVAHCPWTVLLDVNHQNYMYTSIFWSLYSHFRIFYSEIYLVSFIPSSAIECPAIDLPDQSTRNTSAVTYSTRAKYTCTQGLRMRDGATSRTIKCEATGNWSDTVTACRSEYFMKRINRMT